MHSAPRHILVVAMLAACGGGQIQNADKTTGVNTDTAASAPNLVVDPMSVDFGEVDLGSTAMESVTLRNTGTSPLTISQIEADAPFVVTGGAELVLQAGTSSTISVQYTPTDYTASQGSMVIHSDDPDEPTLSVELKGAVVTDSDGDGYDSIDAGGDDCDDDDATIHPDATDTWYDGIDSNCDGADDYDQDGDGYESDVFNSDPNDGGGDCQDVNPDIYPGAEDVWYDGIDSNCDGQNDYDQDGDGYGAKAYGHGQDCNDLDAQINPDAVEKFNGADDDCDGGVDNDVPGYNADYTYKGTASSDWAGTALAMGDLDGDGIDDLVVGSYGYSSKRGLVSVYAGGALPRDGSDITDGQNAIIGDSNNDGFGYAVGFMTDFSGDDTADVAVGAPGANGGEGVVYVFSGADAWSSPDIDNATLTVSGTRDDTAVGTGFSQDLDLDGDGVEDLFGYASRSSSHNLWLLYGGVSGDLTLDDVDARFSTDGSGDGGVQSFPAGGDLDGDGYDDALYCNDKADVDYTDDGAVWVLWGSASRYSIGSTRDIESVGTVVVNGSKNRAGIGSLCGYGPDTDGDGSNELWVYSDNSDGLYVFNGGSSIRSGTLSTSDAALTYSFESSDPAAIRFARIGDWTGDGLDEVAVGIEASSVPGEVWVYSSEITSGSYTANTDMLANLVGDNDAEDNVAFGSALSSLPGDLNGDGLSDWVVSDPEYGNTSGGKSKIGEVYITLQASE